MHRHFFLSSSDGILFDRGCIRLYSKGRWNSNRSIEKFHLHRWSRWYESDRRIEHHHWLSRWIWKSRRIVARSMHRTGCLDDLSPMCFHSSRSESIAMSRWRWPVEHSQWLSLQERRDSHLQRQHGHRSDIFILIDRILSLSLSWIMQVRPWCPVPPATFSIRTSATVCRATEAVGRPSPSVSVSWRIVTQQWSDTAVMNVFRFSFFSKQKRAVVPSLRWKHSFGIPSWLVVWTSPRKNCSEIRKRAEPFWLVPTFPSDVAMDIRTRTEHCVSLAITMGNGVHFQVVPRINNGERLLFFCPDK